MQTNRIAPFAVTFCLATLVGLAGASWGEDWPEWRGQGRLGLWNETGLVEVLPAAGLTYTWRVPIGSGYSGPVVSNGRVITMDFREKPDTKTAEAIERVICLADSAQPVEPCRGRV